MTRSLVPRNFTMVTTCSIVDNTCAYVICENNRYRILIDKTVQVKHISVNDCLYSALSIFPRHCRPFYTCVYLYLIRYNVNMFVFVDMYTINICYWVKA